VVILGGNYLGIPNNPGIIRDLMWGIYEDGNSSDGISYAFKYGHSTNWNLNANVLLADGAFDNGVDARKDLGAWVVADSVVPEPSSIILLGIGGIALDRLRLLTEADTGCLSKHDGTNCLLLDRNKHRFSVRLN
jgi:hypothetical protein